MSANLKAIIEGPSITVYNGTATAISANLRVKITGIAVNGIHPVDVCAKGDAAAGVTLVPLAASGGKGAIRLENASGTQLGTAVAATTAGSPLYGAAGGKVTGTDGGASAKLGTALTTCTADGDLCNYLPAPTLALTA